MPDPLSIILGSLVFRAPSPAARFTPWGAAMRQYAARLPIRIKQFCTKNECLPARYALNY